MPVTLTQNIPIVASAVPRLFSRKRRRKALQDEIKVTQSDPGKFEMTDRDQDQREKLHDALLRLAPFVPDSRWVFGDTPLYLNVNPRRRRARRPIA